MSVIPSAQADGSSGVMIDRPVAEIDLTCWRGSG